MEATRGGFRRVPHLIMGARLGDSLKRRQLDILFEVADTRYEPVSVLDVSIRAQIMNQ